MNQPELVARILSGELSGRPVWIVWTDEKGSRVFSDEQRAYRALAEYIIGDINVLFGIDADEDDDDEEDEEPVTLSVEHQKAYDNMTRHWNEKAYEAVWEVYKRTFPGDVDPTGQPCISLTRAILE